MDKKPTGKRIQIYLPADVLERWRRIPPYERSATAAAALRKYWAEQDAKQEGDDHASTIHRGRS